MRYCAVSVYIYVSFWLLGKRQEIKHDLTKKKWFPYSQKQYTSTCIWNFSTLLTIIRKKDQKEKLDSYRISWNAFRTRSHPCEHVISSRLHLGRESMSSQLTCPECCCHAGHCVAKVASARSNGEPAPRHPSNTYLTHQHLPHSCKPSRYRNCNHSNNHADDSPGPYDERKNSVWEKAESTRMAGHKPSKTIYLPADSHLSM